jgi:hypothetical protein
MPDNSLPSLVFPFQKLRVLLPVASDGEQVVSDDLLLRVMHSCGFNPASMPNLELPDCF